MSGVSGHVPPLLRHLEPAPGEWLSSFLGRLSLANYGVHPRSVIHLVESYLASWGIKDSIFCPRAPETILLLQELTGLDTTALYQLTPHTFTKVFNEAPWSIRESPIPENWSDLLSLEYQSRVLCSEQYLQYCPVCLADGVYYRLNWLPRAQTRCLDHNCFLRNRCPSCDHPLALSSLMMAKCYSCQAHLQGQGVIKALNTGFDFQYLLHSWFTGKGDENAIARHMGLPDISPSKLYELLIVIIGVAANRSLQTMPAPRRELYYHHAVEQLQDWPTRFCHWLDTNRLGPSLVQQLGGQLTALGYWQIPRFPVLEQALLEHSMQKAHYISSTYVERTFHIPTSLVRRLIALGELAATFVSNDVFTIRGQDLYIFRAQWNQPLNLATAQVWLNLPTEVVHRFVQVDLQELETPSDETLSQWFCTKDALCLFYASIEASVLENDFPLEGSLTLEEATHQVSVLVGNRVDLLTYVVRRMLPLWRPTCATTGLGGLRVYQFSLAQVVGQIIADQGLFSILAAAKFLEVTTETVNRWIKEERLIPCLWYQHTPYFTHSTLEDYKKVIQGCRSLVFSHLISLPECHGKSRLTESMIAKSLGITKRALGNLVELDLLQPYERVGEQLYFTKESVLSFQEQFMFLHDVRRFTGKRTNTILAHIGSGVISAVAGPGINGCATYVFCRNVIEEWQGQLARAMV